MTSSAEHQPYVNIPHTIFAEAQAFLRTLKDAALTPPFPEADNLGGWKQRQAAAETNGKALSALFARNLFNAHAEIADLLGEAPELAGRPRWFIATPRTIGLSLHRSF